ncbi:MAG: hypothetical protein JHC54_15060, partial [Acinetobacter sp.]|nr:hypothetical protein [Acinetobacter sp.]
LRIATKALVHLVGDKFCERRYSGKPRTYGCYEQMKDAEQDAFCVEFTQSFRDELLTGKHLCNICVARKALIDIKYRDTLKFAIHPGWIIDNDKKHVFIPYLRLVSLFRLPESQCVRWDEEDPVSYRGRNPNDYIHLYPSSVGNYDLSLPY